MEMWNVDLIWRAWQEFLDFIHDQQVWNTNASKTTWSKIQNNQLSALVGMGSCYSKPRLNPRLEWTSWLAVKYLLVVNILAPLVFSPLLHVTLNEKARLNFERDEWGRRNWCIWWQKVHSTRSWQPVSDKLLDIDALHSHYLQRCI